MMSKKTTILIVSLSFIATLFAVVFVFSETVEDAEASHTSTSSCPPGTYTKYCQPIKRWCSNKGNPPPVPCGCTCTTSSCQDGNVATLNTCGGSVCSSTSCPSGFVDANNNPADGCELSSLNYNIALDPTKGLANKGDTKVTNASLSLTSGSGSATFSATSLPTGTTIAFSPTGCSPACYSNATITTAVATPTGSHLITITATSGSTSKNAIYNLTILGTSATCGNSVCEYPETQSSCASDCVTTTSIPSPVAPGETVTIMVEFYDFRYEANQPVKVDLTINPEGIAWTPANGCFFGGKRMDNAAGGGTIAWPGGTISENGHFKITTSCTLPGTIAAGPHTLVATPTIF